MDFDGIVLREKVRQRNTNVISSYLYMESKKKQTHRDRVKCWLPEAAGWMKQRDIGQRA